MSKRLKYSLVCVLLLMQCSTTHSMQILNKSLNKLEQLQKVIRNPLFNVEETKHLLSNLCLENKTSSLPKKITNEIVDAAERNKNDEEKYATLLSHHFNYGQSLELKSNELTENTVLHTAVRANLAWTSQKIIQFNNALCNAKDFHDRIPLHYVQDGGIAQGLLEKMNKELINHQDVNGDTPLHRAPGKAILSLLNYEPKRYLKNKNSFVADSTVSSENNIYLDHCLTYKKTVTCFGLTPLLSAIIAGDVRKVKILLSREVNGYQTSFPKQIDSSLLDVAQVQWAHFKTINYKEIVSLIQQLDFTSKSYKKYWQDRKSFDEVLERNHEKLEENSLKK